MRTLIVALGFAAVAASPAWAQGVSRASNNGTAAVAAANAGTTTGTTTTTGTSLPSTAVGSDPVLSAPPSSTGTSNTAVSSGGAQTGFGTNTTTDINAATPGSSFAPNGPFSNDSGNSALGTSAGQSSSGTFAGNSSQGIGADSSGLGTNNLPGVATIVPDGNVSTIGTTGSGIVGSPMQQGQQPQQVTIAGQTQTPLFDQAARDGRAKEARRRAAGNEPRIYGIAPNTERDLTWQMPDDRIIRY
jgi:hypothetical protein